MKRLTQEGEDLKAEFELEFGSATGNCSCHISPPCGSCMHPGHPECLENTPEMWEPDND